jgi:tRNA modification GTPase
VLPTPDTIAAIATAHGRGGIGIVRVSGRNLETFAREITGQELSPRIAAYTAFCDAQGEVIDQGIAIYYPAPHSYTGEDVLELQGHGGTAVPFLVLQRCLDLGARLAHPGEFTQRAFLNDKLDLAQAESVADLIDATSTQAARSAMRSLKGEFSRTIQLLVDRLTGLRTFIEAMLDFSDEEIDTLSVERCDHELKELLSDLEHIINLANQGSLLREGAQIVLIGQPNVGKSSLLNSLSEDDIALVSEVPGTTRDIIRQEIHINGIPLHIVDTAGLRDSEDRVEQMGMERTHGVVRKADVILLVLDATRGIGDEEEKIIAGLPADVPCLRIFNKIDLAQKEECTEVLDGGVTGIYLSAKTGSGLNLLKDKLLELIGWHQESGVFMARERHVQSLVQAHKFLSIAQLVSGQLELFAEELRLAQEELGLITGKLTPDDLLGEIFGRFCIGK